MSDESGRAERFPFEIVDAIEALQTREARSVLAELLDHDGSLTHEKTREKLGWADEQVFTATDDLVRGGLLMRRNNGEIGERTDTRYEVTEYGSRVVAKLFETLGRGPIEEQRDGEREEQ